MAHVLTDLLQYLRFDDIDIDNWHFKLYYKGATALFVLGSMVGVLSSYFGEPIRCDFTTIDSDVRAAYMYIVRTSVIIIFIDCI